MASNKWPPSVFQQAIYDWIKGGTGNGQIRAVAGSGKTYTLVEASEMIPPGKTAVFLAFNKSIADELRGKLPPSIVCRTLNSMGLNIFFQNHIQTEKDDDKKFKTIMEVFGEEGITATDKNFDDYLRLLMEMVKKAKQMNINYLKFEEMSDLFALDDMDLDDTMFRLMKKVLDKMKKNTATWEFDDQIWIPVQMKWKCHKFDFVFVDEAQDLNKMQFELVKMVSNGNTRVVAVGDPRQSIYAFRGADTNSMDNFKEFFNMKPLPLSICYRCGKSIVRLAKTIVPEIEENPNQIEGVVEDTDIYSAIKMANEGDFILCRTNAPLIGVAFKLIREGKKAIVKGRDIGTGLLKIVNKYKVKDLNDLEIRISEYMQLQEDKLILIEQGKIDKKKKNSIVATLDSCETILAIADNVETIDELREEIETIFSDDRVGIVCSSVHKAKGCEADRVFIIDYDKMPHPMAKTEIELEQEMNIKYVAITRAKKELYIIH